MAGTSFDRGCDAVCITGSESLFEKVLTIYQIQNKLKRDKHETYNIQYQHIIYSTKLSLRQCYWFFKNSYSFINVNYDELS